MKNGMKIAFVYIGLVIGAGFASGKEVMHFFNRFGNSSFDGIIIAALLFILIAYLIMKKCYNLGIDTFSEYVDIVGGRFGFIFKFIITLFMFSGFCVMVSASGSIVKSIFGINNSVGIWVLLAVCFVVFIFDINGIVAVNSFLTPVMTVGIAYVGVVSYISDSPAFMQYLPGLLKEGLKENFLISSVCYVSYNTITAAAVLIPMRQYFSKISIKAGAFIGGGILGLLMLIVWLAVGIYYDNVYNAEMPMLYIASLNGNAFKWLYGIVLYMAIITTAVSQGFGILVRFKRENIKEKIVKAAAFCLIAAPVSYLGFADLVEKLYTLFGYAGILWMGAIIYDAYFKKNSLL